MERVVAQSSASKRDSVQRSALVTAGHPFPARFPTRRLEGRKSVDLSVVRRRPSEPTTLKATARRCLDPFHDPRLSPGKARTRPLPNLSLALRKEGRPTSTWT